MVKNDKIQFRVSKGTKLVLNAYCKSNKIKVSNLIENALKGYFLEKGEIDIYTLIALADKYADDGLTENAIVFELMGNDVYEKIINR